MFSYLKMNINNIKSEKNMATLSIVRSITNSWRRKFGMNLTSLRIRNSLNVLSTLNPELPSRSPINDWHSSIILKLKIKMNLIEWICELAIIICMGWHGGLHFRFARGGYLTSLFTLNCDTFSILRKGRNTNCFQMRRALYMIWLCNQMGCDGMMIRLCPRIWNM